MKRRDFLTKSALVGSAIPLGIGVPALLTSCKDNTGKNATGKYSAEELGMFSFVEIAPDGEPLKAALIGCGDRGTGAALQFLEAGPNVSIVALADVFSDRMDHCRNVLLDKFNNLIHTKK